MVTVTLIWTLVFHRYGYSCCVCPTTASSRDQWNHLYLPDSHMASVQISSAEQGGGDHRCHLWTRQG